MQDFKPKISILIVNYGSEQYLKNCVASIFNNLENIRLEIIVINNDENEQLNDIKKEFPEVKLINHQKNIGFGAANNLGAKIAQGEILVFLNPDTEILDNDPTKIMDKFEEDSKLAAIGPRLLTAEGMTQQWCAGKENTIWRLIKNNLGMVDSKSVWESDKEIFVDWISGGAMFVRAAVFRDIGGFDERFFMYFEDNDLCKRMRSSGYRILYVPSVVIKHFCGKSAKGKISQKKQFYISGMRYFWKHRKGT